MYQTAFTFYVCNISGSTFMELMRPIIADLIPFRIEAISVWDSRLEFYLISLFHIFNASAHSSFELPKQM